MNEQITNLIPAKFQGEWGYLRSSGDWAISPRFDAAWEFEHCGIARVAINNKVRLINISGKFVGNCTYDAVSSFNKFNVAKAEKNGKWSIVGANGKYLTKMKFDYIGNFSGNGLAMIQKNGLFGYINKFGNIVIKPQFYDAMEFNEEGYTAVRTCKRWQLINEKGEFVTKPIFDCVVGFSINGISPVVVDDKWGYINCRGEFIVEPKYLYASTFGDNEVAVVRCKGETLLINSNGNVVLGPFSQYHEMNCDYVKAMGVIFAADLEGVYSILDMTGNCVIHTKYDNYDIKTLNGTTLVFVQQNKKWGVMNQNFKEIISPRFRTYHTGFYGIIGESTDCFTYINHYGEIIADKIKTYRYSSECLLVEINNELFSINKNDVLEKVSDIDSFSYYPSWVKVEVDEIHLQHWIDTIDTREFYIDYNDEDIVRGYNLYD